MCFLHFPFLALYFYIIHLLLLLLYLISNFIIYCGGLMKMASIGSYIYMLSCQLVNCLRRMRRCVLVEGGISSLEEVCHWVSAFETHISLYLLPVDQDVKFWASVPGPCLCAWSKAPIKCVFLRVALLIMSLHSNSNITKTLILHCCYHLFVHSYWWYSSWL